MGAARAMWLGWGEELRPLRLSRGGRIAATVSVLLVLTIAMLTALTGVAFAFYNLFSGRDTDNAVAIQILFTLIVVFVSMMVLVGVSLGAIAGVDAAVRGIRWSVRRSLAKPS